MRYESASARAAGLSFEGLQLIGTDFSREFLGPCNCNGQQIEQSNRHGMVRLTNASDVVVSDCRLRDAGHSAIFVEGWAQNVVRACRFEA